MSNTAAQQETPAGQALFLRNVSVSAGTRLLLENVSIAFPANEISLIVGPSGVGKSILLRMIAGLTDTFEAAIQVSGEILIGDQPAKAGDSGVVFQNFALFDEMSPIENLNFARSSATGARLTQTPSQLLEQLTSSNQCANGPIERRSTSTFGHRPNADV